MNTYIQGPMIDRWPLYRTDKEQKRVQFAIDYIKGDFASPSPLHDFLTSDPAHSRLLLYLPLAIISDPSALDHAVVRQVFRELLHHRDVRESFNEGDISDVPPDQRVRVVKILHLTPWLLRGGHLDGLDLIALAEMAARHKKELALSGLRDVMPFLNDAKLLKPIVFRRLSRTVSGGSHQAPEPSLNAAPMTAERQKWLAEREYYRSRDHTIKLAHITGPFADNFGLDEYNFISEILTKSPKGATIRVYGSRTKGYGRSESDLDYEVVSRAEIAAKEPNPENAHLVFNSFYASQSLRFKGLRKVQCALAAPYARLAPDDPRRRDALASLEKDLLQYRLLHKGFPYAYHDLSPETRAYPAMDGASAFYDDRYRKVASELFLKYVYLPQL